MNVVIVGGGKVGSHLAEILLQGGHTVRVVDDQVLTPTYTGDLAEVVCQLLQTTAYGLYHVSAEGQCSWYEFAQTIFELEQTNVDVHPVCTAEFPSSAQRPAYSVLSKEKLRGLGLIMPGWKEGLARYLAARKQIREQTTRSR